MSLPVDRGEMLSFDLFSQMLAVISVSTFCVPNTETSPCEFLFEFLFEYVQNVSIVLIP